MEIQLVCGNSSAMWTQSGVLKISVHMIIDVLLILQPLPFKKNQTRYPRCSIISWAIISKPCPWNCLIRVCQRGIFVSLEHWYAVVIGLKAGSSPADVAGNWVHLHNRNGKELLPVFTGVWVVLITSQLRKVFVLHITPRMWIYLI